MFDPLNPTVAEELAMLAGWRAGFRANAPTSESPAYRHGCAAGIDHRAGITPEQRVIAAERRQMRWRIIEEARPE